MTQWHPQGWHLQPILVAAMAVVVINYAAAVDATATGIHGSGKNAIAAAAIDHHFHQG